MTALLQPGRPRFAEVAPLRQLGVFLAALGLCLLAALHHLVDDGADAGGRLLDRFHAALTGHVATEEAGRRAVTEAETVVGEIAVLLSRPASAKVTLDQGCYYFVWTAEDIKRAIEAKPGLGGALIAGTIRSLAPKVATAELAGWVVEEIG